MRLLETRTIRRPMPPRDRPSVRDKQPFWARRPKTGTYCGGVTAPQDPQERAYALARWANRVVHETMAARGWSKVRTIKETGISRSTVDRWLNADISKGTPKIDKITQFCEALNLDLVEPYRIMGWQLNPAADAAVEARRVLPPEVVDLLRYMDTLTPQRVQRVRMRLRFLLLEERAMDGEVPDGQSTEDGTA